MQSDSRLSQCLIRPALSPVIHCNLIGCARRHLVCDDSDGRRRRRRRDTILQSINLCQVKRDRRPKIYTHKVHGWRGSQQAHCTLPQANASFLHKQKYRTRRKSKVWAVEALENLADWTVWDRKWTSFIRTFFLAHLSGLCSHGEKPPPTGVPPASHCNGNEREGEEMKNHFSLLPQKTFATIRRRGGGRALPPHIWNTSYTSEVTQETNAKRISWKGDSPYKSQILASSVQTFTGIGEYRIPQDSYGEKKERRFDSLMLQRREGENRLQE